MTEPTQLQLQMGLDPESDPEELSGLMDLLRDELLELDVEAADAVPAGEAPPGSKGIDFALAGALVVKLVRSRGLLQAVVNTVSHWVQAARMRGVRIEIDGDVLEVTGVSSQEQRALIDAWIQRHSQPQG